MSQSNQLSQDEELKKNEALDFKYQEEQASKPTTTTVTASIDSLQGHLRNGHFEAEFTDEQLEEFKGLDDEGKADMIRDLGVLVVDDYEVNGYDDISDFSH